MSSLVDELQKDALDHSVNTSDLLRKAHSLSTKLNLTDVQQWLLYELNGYSLAVSEALIPNYRLLYGSPLVFNPHSGWIPLTFENQEEADALSKLKSTQSITELQELISQSDLINFHFTYPEHIANVIDGLIGSPSQPVLVVPRSVVMGILNQVRNKILNWALKLEEEGIVE